MGKNRKTIFLLLSVLILTAFFCAFFASCNIDDVKEISVTPGEVNVRIGEFDYEDYKVTVTYDSGKTEEFVLTEDMIAPKDRLKFFLEGEYDVEVKYLQQTTSLSVKVRRNVFEGATFDDLDVVYNGEFYTVEVKNVPEGTTVTYPTTNRFRNAGEYQATAVLRKDAYEMKEMTSNVLIRKADYDLSQTTFTDKTEVYDGNSHLLAMDGALPTGLYVDYTITREGGREEKGNAAQNAGVYTVEARFSGDFNNYNAIEAKSATLTIRQAEIDVSGIKFEDQSVEFDRTMHRIELDGVLPSGISVAYLNNEHVDAGAYEATAIFSVDDIVNYASIPDKKAVLTIRKADYDMSAVHFNGTKSTFDGKEKKIEIQGQLPNGLTVSYENNVATDAGSYLATAIFRTNNVNYNDPEPMTATMIIDPALAPMDQIEFERRRFISQKSSKDEMPQWYWDMILETDDPENSGYKDMLKVYYYDPYLAAKRYVPQNVPTGLEIASVKYKETAGWVDDLTGYDGEGDGYFGEDLLDHDGYYVVFVTFDGGKNYTGLSPIKTLIRVSTVESFSTWEQFIYDDDWLNPDTGDNTGAFMDYYSGSCVAWTDLDSITYGDLTLQYCDCNIFHAFAENGKSALVYKGGDYVPESKLASFKTLAEKYVSFVSGLGIDFDSSMSANPREYEYWFETELGFSDLYTRTIVREDEDPDDEYDTEGVVKIEYDNSNPFGMIAGDFGDLASLTQYTAKTPSDSVSDAFDDLAALFSAFMGNFTIPTDGSTYAALIEGDAADDYAAFFDAVSAVFADARVSYARQSYSLPEDSAVIGANYPFTIGFEENDRLSECDLQTLIANLFGFLSKAEFTAYAQTLAETYAQYRTDVQNSVAVNKALENGCFFTENGSFIFPFSVYNDQLLKVFTLVIVDADGRVSVWVDDVRNALYVTDYNDDFFFAKTVNNVFYGKTLLFTPLSFVDLLTAAEAAAKPLTDESSEFFFKAEKMAYLPLDDSFDYVAVTHYDGGKTADDYYELTAKIFGFENVDDFFGWDKITGQVFNTYLSDSEFLTEAGVSMESVSAQLACAGGIYEKIGDDIVFMFPYSMNWIDANDVFKDEFIIVFCSSIGGAGFDCGVLFSDAEAFFKLMSDAPEQEVLLKGRCLTAELPVIRLMPKTKIVNENGVEVNRAIISGKEFLFIEQSAATDHLVFENNDVYRFLPELSGNCAEETEGYDANQYKFETAQAIYSFCDCDPFATVIRANGDATDLSKREGRDDHAQMTSEVALKFDRLSDLYQTFICNYTVGDDVVNEWKLSASNRNYNAYKSFFDYAYDMMSKSNRNMGKGADGILSKSAIVGMNQSFCISVNGSGNDYTLDQYRMIVQKLFGFADLETFTAYTEAIAETLVANRKNANVDSVSARLLYDGAVLTENGYYVLPFSIKSETSTKRVLVIVFVDPRGMTTIWINDVRNAFAATNFGEAALETADKYTVSISGRCMLFEDDGYIMKEDLSKNVEEMINNLLNFARYMFSTEQTLSNCKETNETRDDDDYWYDDREDAIYLFCDCDPFIGLIRENGNASAITKRRDRGDIADMTAEVAEKFDSLSALYQTFISQYDADTLTGADKKIGPDDETFLAYRRFFRGARDLFAESNNGIAVADEYLWSDSAIVGMNKNFVFSAVGNGAEYTVDDYRLTVAKLFGFADLETLTSYTEALASALVANEKNAGVGSISDRLIYDGAIRTTNGGYVLPFFLQKDTLKCTVLAFVFVDANGTMTVWIHNVKSAFDLVDFTVPLDGKDIVLVNGRCALFEKSDYFGLYYTQKEQYVGVEKIKTFASSGDFLIYNSYTDDEGFEVYCFSVYDYNLEVIYEDLDNNNLGTVQKGFYTLINVASIDDVCAYNQQYIDDFESEGAIA